MPIDTYTQQLGVITYASDPTEYGLTLEECQQKCRDGTWVGCELFARPASAAPTDLSECTPTQQSNSYNDEHSGVRVHR